MTTPARTPDIDPHPNPSVEALLALRERLLDRVAEIDALLPPPTDATAAESPMTASYAPNQGPPATNWDAVRRQEREVHAGRAVRRVLDEVDGAVGRRITKMVKTYREAMATPEYLGKPWALKLLHEKIELVEGLAATIRRAWPHPSGPDRWTADQLVETAEAVIATFVETWQQRADIADTRAGQVAAAQKLRLVTALAKTWHAAVPGVVAEAREEYDASHLRSTGRALD